MRRRRSVLRVAAVGEVGLDVYGERGVATLGGCSCNLARAVADAGARALLFAPVGDDPRGGELLAALAETPLELRVRGEPGATARQQIRIAPDGERTLCGWEPGVVAAYRPSEAELAELASCDVIALADTPAWDACLALRGPRRVADFSQDAATRWRFDGLDLAFIGGAAADLERVRPHAAARPIVLTAGAAGAWALDGDHVWHQPSLAHAIADTTGCGDAFQGAFVVAYFGGASLPEALEAGARAAARVAAHVGAGPAPLRMALC